jgi:hypothetical protein
MNEGAAELFEVAGKLSASGPAASVAARLIVQKGALNIKRTMQDDARGIGHAPHFPDSITYETRDRPWGAEGEIGPDKDRRQGALGNILYFGTSKNGPVRNISTGLDAEAPRFEKALADAAEVDL